MGGDFFSNVFALIDTVVELYLAKFIKVFLNYHEVFYNKLNAVLRKAFDDNKASIPDWFTANFITYFRTLMVIPTIMLLVGGYTIFPSVMVLLVDFGDFLDGVVARFWIDDKKLKDESLQQQQQQGSKSSATTSPSPSPVHSDDESFEVITNGSPQVVPSWVALHMSRTYGGFIDAVCDKAFVVPCWISLFNFVSSEILFLKYTQYLVLWFLILAEVASGCIRFRAYFSSVGVSVPKVEGFDFSTSAVKADHVGKAKQTFEMVGTALFVLPWARLIGVALLALAVPLAYESVRRKVNTRVFYVHGKTEKLDHKILKFWMQAKTMGSKLIVGFSDKNTDMILNACAVSCVDEVVAEAPEKLDLMFLEKHAINYCICRTGDPQFVTDEVIQTGRCLEIGEDGVARLYKLKDPAKKE
ncbi:CDP-alcohol phosphatidyltransferase [Nitzschia inconspicua]|uniref:CDP-alcohol phosphatidyltransferase n=1 Tax=Nitzschia inconspicua TaxID=303405 RepID=A0A9K3L496_9STRA|nr:CDP-alcohol phosphatidyltransferase [Nitzschia inconspicua]